jgi:hypothetical protein
VIEDGRISLKRVDYSIDEAIARTEASDLPDRAKWLYAEGLRLGRLPQDARLPQRGPA